MDFTLGGKKVEPKTYTFDSNWGDVSGTFTFGIDPAAGLDDTVVVTSSPAGELTGKIVRKTVEPGMTTLDIKFNPPAARGSGVYDPSILPPGITATSGTGYKITGTWGTSRTWTIPLPTDFVYGDVVHHKDCPEQREMVVRVAGNMVHTLVLDNADDTYGQTTAYTADVLVRVE